MQRTSSAQSGEAPRDPGPRSPAESKGPAARMSPAGTQTPDALKRLGRRSTRVVLAMAPGADRDLVRGALAEAGYLRLETMDSLGQAVADLRADRSPSCPLLILEMAEGEEVNVGAVRDLQREFSDSREIPAAVISRGETMPDTDDPLLRPMTWPSAEDVTWQPLLDELAGLD